MNTQHDPFGESFKNWQYTNGCAPAEQVPVLLAFIKQNCGSKEFDDFLKDDVTVQLAVGASQGAIPPRKVGSSTQQARYLLGAFAAKLGYYAVQPLGDPKNNLDFALAAKALAEAAAVVPVDVQVAFHTDSKPPEQV